MVSTRVVYLNLKPLKLSTKSGLSMIAVEKVCIIFVFVSSYIFPFRYKAYDCFLQQLRTLRKDCNFFGFQENQGFTSFEHSCPRPSWTSTHSIPKQRNWCSCGYQCLCIRSRLEGRGSRHQLQHAFHARHLYPSCRSHWTSSWRQMHFFRFILWWLRTLQVDQRSLFFCFPQFSIW